MKLVGTGAVLEKTEYPGVCLGIYVWTQCRFLLAKAFHRYFHPHIADQICRYLRVCRPREFSFNILPPTCSWSPLARVHDLEKAELHFKEFLSWLFPTLQGDIGFAFVGQRMHTCSTWLSWHCDLPSSSNFFFLPLLFGISSCYPIEGGVLTPGQLILFSCQEPWLPVLPRSLPFIESHFDVDAYTIYGRSLVVSATSYHLWILP